MAVLRDLPNETLYNITDLLDSKALKNLRAVDKLFHALLTERVLKGGFFTSLIEPKSKGGNCRGANFDKSLRKMPKNMMKLTIEIHEWGRWLLGGSEELLEHESDLSRFNRTGALHQMASNVTDLSIILRTKPNYPLGRSDLELMLQSSLSYKLQRLHLDLKPMRKSSSSWFLSNISKSEFFKLTCFSLSHAALTKTALVNLTCEKTSKGYNSLTVYLTGIKYSTTVAELKLDTVRLLGSDWQDVLLQPACMGRENCGLKRVACRNLNGKGKSFTENIVKTAAERLRGHPNSSYSIGHSDGPDAGWTTWTNE